MTISRRQRTRSAVERKKPEWRGGPVSFWPERFGICRFSRHDAARRMRLVKTCSPIVSAT